MKRVARLLERVVEKGEGDLEETIRRICICEPVELNIVIIAVQTKRPLCSPTCIVLYFYSLLNHH